jgi:hypothetical protein
VLYRIDAAPSTGVSKTAHMAAWLVHCANSIPRKRHTPIFCEYGLRQADGIRRTAEGHRRVAAQIHAMQEWLPLLILYGDVLPALA